MNIAFIPVRGGSKSIPLKNIKEINEKPLVYWTANAANSAKCIDKVVIATDCEKIRNIVLSFGFEKLEVYDRNSKNAQDTSSTESVMIEYIEKSEHIDNMYEKYVKSGADSIFSGVLEKQFKWKFNDKKDLIPVNYDYKKRPRRQDFEGLVAETGACYINKIGNILQDKCRLSGKITYYEMPSYTMFELDEEDDWIFVEGLMKKIC